VVPTSRRRECTGIRTVLSTEGCQNRGMVSNGLSARGLNQVRWGPAVRAELRIRTRRTCAAPPHRSVRPNRNAPRTLVYHVADLSGVIFNGAA
jgi:hypothetical protein